MRNFELGDWQLLNTLSIAQMIDWSGRNVLEPFSFIRIFIRILGWDFRLKF